jgi:hypothetical protein
MAAACSVKHTTIIQDHVSIYQIRFVPDPSDRD